MLISDLEKLGLSEEEAKVYLAILELGGGYASTIAKKANIHRVNTYYIIEKLQEKELVNMLTKNGMKYFTVDNPKALVNQIEDKLEQAQKLLPQLLSITNSLAYKPKIQYYEGIQGVKNLFEATLQAQGEIVGYTNLEELPKVVPKDYLKDFAKRKIEAGIKTRMLSPMTPKAQCYLQNYYPKNYDLSLTEILFINRNEYPFEYEINIYDHFVTIISLNEKEPIGMIMESERYAKTQRSAFNLAWLGATSFVAR